MVLLDGLDEVPNQFTNSVMDASDKLVTRYEDNRFLDILLEEWAAEKRLNQEPIHEGLHTDLEKMMLAEIAHKGFKDDQLFFSEQQIIKSITDFLADSVDNPKYLDGKNILNAIAAQQGILVQRAEDVYSFSHLTLQEYLTAQYISQDDSRIEQLVRQHLKRNSKSKYPTKKQKYKFIKLLVNK